MSRKASVREERVVSCIPALGCNFSWGPPVSLPFPRFGYSTLPSFCASSNVHSTTLLTHFLLFVCLSKSEFLTNTRDFCLSRLSITHHQEVKKFPMPSGWQVTLHLMVMVNQLSRDQVEHISVWVCVNVCMCVCVYAQGCLGWCYLTPHDKAFGGRKM